MTYDNLFHIQDNQTRKYNQLTKLQKVKSYSTTQPLAAKYSYIMYSVIDSSDTSFAYTENI